MRFSKIILLYSVGALMGPFLRLATWPPGSSNYERLVYDLVFLLWPTQMFAVAENYMGKTGGIILAISLNVVLFIVIGVTMMAVKQKRLYRLLVGSLVIMALLLLCFWGAGFDYSQINCYALILALVLYGLLLYTTTII